MKAKTVIKTAADFLIETDLFDALEIGGNCFCSPPPYPPAVAARTIPLDR